ncbi:Plant cadmium resistance [Thalictrum thalictroides]|uniref:Plant cadmium resistance n=1 Tax=Thalictrum thalictroides TaxID=46969 RepID=A0A7J6VT68_THATH|nr:Plant cadmium resistance [Thalictrum thalictroides]
MAANEQKPVFGMEGSHNNQERRTTTGEPFPHAPEPYDMKSSAIMTAFLPCVTFGQITEILDEVEMTCPLGSFIYLLMMPALCCQWVMGSKYSGKLRKKYNLVEAPYEDWASHVFCPSCSLCQEFRGFDPALGKGLGWNGILAQQQAQRAQGQAQYPPQNQAMLN